MKKNILITGATGMIGKKLTDALLNNGDSVSILSRKAQQIKNVKVYVWDVYKQEIDQNCLTGIDTVIHLAGENIAEKKWTKERKQQIIDSRVLSAELLYKTIENTNAPVKVFISASAAGYYGNRGDEILAEDSPPEGMGFLARCCKQWEDAADYGKMLGLRVVKFRTGFILSKGEGALASLEKPIRFFAGAPLGSGKQWVPWVHIDDIVQMYVEAVNDESIAGAYNACAPFPVTNATLTSAIAKKIHRPVWPFHVPEKVLKMILGQMSAIALISTNTSAQKLLDSRFQFKYTRLENALADIYKK